VPIPVEGPEPATNKIVLTTTILKYQMTEPGQIKKKILVVDNNPVILKLISELLNRHKHEVYCAEDVFSCLDTLVNITPDIIFLDLIMPHICGDDLCKIIRKMDHMQKCYIAIVSGIAMEHDVDFLRIGANACIAKGPFKVMSRYILNAINDSEKPHNAPLVSKIQGVELLHSRQITKELLQQNHHLKVILESMNQGILELNQNRIAYVNPQAIKLLGKSRETLLGSKIEHTLSMQLQHAIHDNTSSTELFSTVQLTERQVFVEQFPIKNNKQIKIVMLSDITERKRLEAVIEATNLTENLGYVFSGIRHEIGNPVNSIKMALSVLQKNLREYDIDTVAEFLDRSLQEVSRIEYLLKALKNYSLFESPVTQELSATEFITNFISLIQNDFMKQNIQVQTIISHPDLTILADSRALHHILLNLLTNAADAVENSEQPKITISVNKKDHWVEIKVNDNGKGMSENDQDNLFKPFFTSKSTGTGLGLVNVRKMLTAMNSRIGIESCKGMGTTVTIILPESEDAWS
jgi:PAS domain S-box-containing protein